jgi:hypothetical protein
MTHRSRISLKTELERSALEMVKAARRLAKIKKGDALWAGTCKETLNRLSKIEKQIHKHRKKSGSETRIQEIAKELADLIGRLCKSLIRYQYHFRMKYCYFAFS